MVRGGARGGPLRGPEPGVGARVVRVGTDGPLEVALRGLRPAQRDQEPAGPGDHLVAGEWPRLRRFDGLRVPEADRHRAEALASHVALQLAIQGVVAHSERFSDGPLVRRSVRDALKVATQLLLALPTALQSEVQILNEGP
jgi:hypothetical protein